MGGQMECLEGSDTEHRLSVSHTVEFFFSSLQITDSQADTLEYQVAEALQELITKNAKNNEIEDIESNDRDVRGEQDDQGSDTNMVTSANLT